MLSRRSQAAAWGGRCWKAMPDFAGRTPRHWLAALACVSLLPSPSGAVTFTAAFTSTTYQTVGGDSYATLLAAHQAGPPLPTTAMTGFENASTSFQADVTTDDSTLLTA